MVDFAPLVSVIVVTYNSGRYVLETLESVREQTYPSIELIITDDSSSDDTVQICKEWCGIHENHFKSVKLVKSPVNTGIPANSNRGLSRATGEWIKFIDGDDKLLPGCLESYISTINGGNESKVFFAKAVRIDENGNQIEYSNGYYKGDNSSFREYFFKLSTKQQLKHYSRETIFLVVPTIFINARFLREIGGFDENFRIFEDIPLTFKILNNGKQIGYLDQETVMYRMHDFSVSRKKDKKISDRGLQEHQDIYSRFRKPNLTYWNLFDLGCRFEAWLTYVYSHQYHLKGARFLRYLNVYRWYKLLFFRW